MGTCINSGNWYFLYTSGYHIVAFAFLLSVFHLHCFKILVWNSSSVPWCARQRKLTVTLFMMTIVSLLLWLPFVVYTFVLSSDLVRVSFLTHLRLRLSFSLLYRTNSLVNPIIYTIRMPEFRRALLILFKRRQRQNAAIPLQAR